jgi:hypothetical protein
VATERNLVTEKAIWVSRMTRTSRSEGAAFVH